MAGRCECPRGSSPRLLYHPSWDQLPRAAVSVFPLLVIVHALAATVWTGAPNQTKEVVLKEAPNSLPL